MLCEHCNKNVATVHLIEIINQEKKEVNLCEGCAQEAGLPFTKPTLSVTDLFGIVQSGLSPTARKRDSEIECPDCRMSLREFRTKGRLGCPKDYEVFKGQLEGLLEKIHGASRHVGKAPRASKENKKDLGEEMENLRRKLNLAVKQEDYEEAARLRDRINELEKKAKSAT